MPETTSAYQSLNVQPREDGGIKSKLHKFLYLVLILAILCIIGLSIGLGFALRQNNAPAADPESFWIKPDDQFDEQTRKFMFDAVSATNMRNNLRVVSKELHLAGTPANDDVGKFLVNTYRSYGMQVKTYIYDVQLNYPDFSKPNTVYSVDGNGNHSQLVSDGLGEYAGPPEAVTEESGDKNVRNQWNAWTKPGKVTAQVVYANFGTVADFDKLASLNVSVVGKIALVRYGHLWRGAKAREAVKRGCVGVIIFSDPQQYGPQPGEPEGKVFPNSTRLPKEGAQRGTTKNSDGDALTPYHEAKPYIWRSENETTLRKSFDYPDAPVTPVSAAAAKQIFDRLNGPPVPASFAGGLNTTYRLTGVTRFELSVHGFMTEKPITNVCGYIRGSAEPDQVIIFGNHYDAWSNGAVDPNSGTTVALEIARVMMKAVNETKWRPRRSIAVCNWDAEEYGLLGSVEWVEQMERLLATRAVAVLNVDTAVTGNQTLSAAGTPTMHAMLVNATRMVANPNKQEKELGRNSVYDSTSFYNAKKKTLPGLPLLSYPGSGSDHYPFMSYSCVPVISYSYTCDGNDEQCNPLYHSLYEVPWLLENIYSRHGKAFVALAQTSLELLRSLASSIVVPLDVHDYSVMLTGEVKKLVNDMQMYKDSIPALPVQLDQMSKAVRLLTNATEHFAQVVKRVRKEGGDAQLLRRIDSRLVQFERTFMDPRGVHQRRPTTRHTIFGKSEANAYAGIAFPGIRDSMGYIDEAKKNRVLSKEQKWRKQLLLCINSVLHSIHSAVNLLNMDPLP